MKRLLLASALLLASCGGSATAPSIPAPPTVASVDQQMAGWLLTAQNGIEQAKGLVATNPGMKDPLNKVIATYNTLESSYLIFHQSVAQGGKPDPSQLSAEIQQLAQGVAALTSIYGGKP